MEALQQTTASFYHLYRLLRLCQCFAEKPI
jgi:hypothetical protein